MTTDDHLGSAKDHEQLRHIQAATTRVLGEIDRVCAYLHIPYVVYGGTAIGAVRHHGFIPWDDDADVCMTRNDYERFLAEAPTVLNPAYALECTRTNDEFPVPFAVCTLVGTRFVSEVAKNRLYQMPIGVDVFPLDNMPDSQMKFKIQSLQTWFWGRLMYLRGTPIATIDMPSPLRDVVLAIAKLVHYALKVLRVSPGALQRHWERSARRFDGTATSWLADYSTRSPRHWAVREDELYPPIEVPFGDVTVKLPRQFDRILTRQYGDYSKLPPVTQRWNHGAFLVDFGPSEP